MTDGEFKNYLINELKKNYIKSKGDFMRSLIMPMCAYTEFIEYLGKKADFYDEKDEKCYKDGITDLKISNIKLMGCFMHSHMFKEQEKCVHSTTEG
jgi:hypothetical protein